MKQLTKKVPNKNVYEAVSHFSKCRDFLSDVLYAEATKSKVSLYGFSYDGTTPKLPKKSSVFGLKFKSLTEIDNFIAGFNAFDTYFCNLAQVKPSKYKQDNNIIVITADKQWTKTTFAISLYTFLLKCYRYQDETSTIDSFFKKVAESKTT